MRKRMVGAISVAAMLVAGCGASDDYANEPRPPKPIALSIAITDGRVLVSPMRPGAGPARVTVSNQSRRARDLRLAPPEGSDSACVESDLSSGPINPMGTASFNVDLVEGDCLISAGSPRRGPRPALLRVGRERPSSQQTLLLP